MGTIGYAAPEYAGGGQVSTAADVYSFGVVLFEIFIRRRPTDDIFKDELNIVKFIEASFPGRVLEIVDPQLLQELEETPMALKEKCSECLLSMLNVGLSCTKPSPGDRINMQEVAAKLHGIKDAYLNSIVSSSLATLHRYDVFPTLIALSVNGTKEIDVKPYPVIQGAGRFPQAILNLSTLTILELAANGLSGEVPPNLFTSLPDLQILFLGGNLFLGHLPSSFTNASNIQALDLSRNNFTGLMPTTIGKLTKLLSLNLENNELQAHNREDWEFLNSLGNCTELQMFSMGYNHLSGHVPSSLGNLSSQLQELYLTNNQLSGDFPSGIANLRNLIFVALGRNNFTGVVPMWIGTLKAVQVPMEIFRIPAITGIDLSFNSLDGQLPTGIGNAKQLVILRVSSNKLSGDIPNTLGDCESLEGIELDSNIFSGSIPTSLAKISSLKVLNLSTNNLTGSIPASLGSLELLEDLDLSFNHLNGEVPTKGIFRNATTLKINGNQGLCGGVKELHILACSDVPSNSTRHKESLVLKVVIPIACVVSLAVVIFGYLLWIRKHNSKSISLPSFSTKLPKVSFNDLTRATAGFSTPNLIGRGRYSSVYQGKLLEDQNEVAIKVFNLEIRGAHKSFIAECNALRNVRHRNLVPILTACSSIDSKGNDFKALVYELMPRGDLHKLLYSTQDYECSSDLNLIMMAQRISIVVDVADALEYLHHNNQETMIHCDLKPSNILLDDNMTAHVGDFGLSRFKVGSTMSSLGNPNSSSVAVMGTIGYAAPEASFPGRVLEIVDPQLLQELEETPMALKEKCSECLLSMLKVGLSCTKPSPGDRINMQEVAAKLHGIKDAYFDAN
ncbi:unnamed protein product [Triticum turgidum subsp. durum]|uniref:Receptor kinase-like protein Xa21 n=1 Tax=Triticum turgidum subsp. durum TaxID=4567 RepID=A0A9R0VGR4_TRITD|nr:unnamed protein product [Triticum turgidum subsp. durum]